MAQFDAYALVDGGIVVDRQADQFADIARRLVIPLERPEQAHRSQPRLNPVLQVDGERMMLLTQFATAVRASELRKPIASLIEEPLKITNAFDMLLTGV